MIGRRGAYLLFKSVLNIAIGLSYLFSVHVSQAYGAFGFLHMLDLPFWVLGIPWILTALPAIWCAFIRLPHTDKWGFESLMVAPVAWSLIYFMGDILGTQPHGWFLGVVFLGLAGATYTVSGMVSPTELPAHKAIEEAKNDVS
jgi:hypothetical protein